MYQVDIESNGNFPLLYGQMFILSQNDQLSLSLTSRQIGQNLLIINQSMDQQLTIDQQFQIHDYHVQKGQYNEEGVWTVQITMDKPGLIRMQVIWVEQKSNDVYKIIKLGKSENVLINPIINLNNQQLKLNQLKMQTLLTKQLGYLDEWNQLIQKQSKLKFNCYHLSPIQKYGPSGSLYCISDQLEIDDMFYRKQMNRNQKWEQLKTEIERIKNENGCLLFVDILLNHTSYDSEWLNHDSEGYYNVENTPYLHSALVFDQYLQTFSSRMMNCQLVDYKDNKLYSHHDVDKVIEIMRIEVKQLKLEEYHMMDQQKVIESFELWIQNQQNTIKVDNDDDDNVFNFIDQQQIMYDFIRNNMIDEGSGIHMTRVDLTNLNSYLEQFKQIGSIDMSKLSKIINRVNNEQKMKLDDYMNQALHNLKHQIIYHKLEENKPIITKENPLVPCYFSKLENGKYAANNGWIMNYQGSNFVEDKDSFYYLRRSIVIWSDLVKLRYTRNGKLLQRMEQYVNEMSSVFDGIRLDNAHSTELWVGEYLINGARSIKPSLILFAELFTGDEGTDVEFTKRMGINALVREGQRNYGAGDFIKYGQIDRQSLGRLNYQLYDGNRLDQNHNTTLLPLQPLPLYYDLTHDNPSYQNYKEQLSRIAVLSSINCFIGSTFGYDEVYTSNVNVVQENRKYHIIENVQEVGINTIDIQIIYQGTTGGIQIKGSWDNWEGSINMDQINQHKHRAIVKLPNKNSIYEYKLIIDGEWVYDSNKKVVGQHMNNELDVQQYQILNRHSNFRQIRKYFNQLELNEYSNIYLETRQNDIIQIIRENPKNGKFVTILVRNDNYGSEQVDFQLQMPGQFISCDRIFYINSDNRLVEQNDNQFGYREIEIIETDNIRQFCELNNQTELDFTNIPCYFVAVLYSEQRNEILDSKRYLSQKLLEIPSLSFRIGNLSTGLINHLLYQCEPENLNNYSSNGYSIDNKGVTVYQGIAGIYYDIINAFKNQDLGIALFQNIRQGNWLINHYISRLQIYPELRFIQQLLTEYSNQLYQIPKHEIPKYFGLLIMSLYQVIKDEVYKKSVFKQNNELVKQMIMSSYQFIGFEKNHNDNKMNLTYSAGLPHFSTGWSRQWGRDTFISLKGGLLLQGMYKEAKSIILRFGSALRHGLLPNLLDNCSRPRYNCRDTVWWFIKGIQDYIQITNDVCILSEMVEMVFLSSNLLEHNNLKNNGGQKYMKLEDIVYSIVQEHVNGIHFREWFGGYNIDQNMTNCGFQIELKVDIQTGFIIGGNQWNCLTWMDKMGSSVKAQNKGQPATSRDGAPIEMTALLFNALEFITTINQQYPQYFQNQYCILQDKNKLYFNQWKQKISDNFNKYYYIPIQQELDFKHIIQSDKVQQRGIYKDIVKCKNVHCDYQMRPNMLIAMGVAPQLFRKDQMLIAIEIVEQKLICNESLGVKTLDPDDMYYVSFYDNQDQSDSKSISQGFSYHQGPEWVWIYGYYLIAQIRVHQKYDKKVSNFMKLVANLRKQLFNNEWLSIPEMTNHNGQFNQFSCPAQAWSIATVLEAIHLDQNL